MQQIYKKFLPNDTFPYKLTPNFDNQLFLLKSVITQKRNMLFS